MTAPTTLQVRVRATTYEAEGILGFELTPLPPPPNCPPSPPGPTSTCTWTTA